MGTYRDIIEEAELALSDRHEIISYLQQRANQSKSEPLYSSNVENILLQKKDPLIDLALAKYSLLPDTARELFARTERNDPIRLAVLSNQYVDSYHSILEIIFDDDTSMSDHFVSNASDEELNALFENPRVGDSFLRDLLEGNDLWKGLDEQTQLIILRALSNNERMRTPYDESFLDGYADYSYHAVFTAAWSLAETINVSYRSAVVLSNLYWHLIPSSAIKDPLEIAKRWVASETNKSEDEKKDNSVGHLSPFQKVRQALAKLAVSKGTNYKTLLGSDDLALRSCAYAIGYFSPSEISSAYEQDGKVAFREFLENKYIWRHAELRDALKELAWKIVNEDANSSLDAANFFNWSKERFLKTHPEWFLNDEESDIQQSTMQSEERDLGSKILESTELIQSNNKLMLDYISSKLTSIHLRLVLIWWFSLLTLIGLTYLILRV